MQLTEFYIIGPPRSGTTMLARLISGGDRVLSLSEPYLCRNIMAPWQLDRFFYRFQRSASLKRRRPPLRGSERHFAYFLRQMAQENGFRYLALKETYRRGGLKSNWHNEPLLDRIVAGPAPVVALIRHPDDVAASTIKLGRWVTGLPGRLIRLRLPRLCTFSSATDIVRWAAQNWVDYVDWARRSSLELIRYEDVVANPRDELRAICSTCDVEFAESMLDGTQRSAAFGGIGDVGALTKPRRVDRNSIGHGNRLTDEQRRIIRDTCASIAPEFDYSLTSGSTPSAARPEPSGLASIFAALTRQLTSRPARQR